MKKLVTTLVALAGVLLAPFPARAHCDAVDGPVATAALKALDTKNVNLILPYAPAKAEAELIGVFEQAFVVRGKAKALADRYFMETAVRLHRAGEAAPYAGLRPAGTDFGPAIPAAERALESGQPEPLLGFLTQEMRRGIVEHLERALVKRAATKEPETRAGVEAARERVSAELEFIGYVESLYRGARGGGHAE